MKHMLIVLLLMVGTYSSAQDVQQSKAVGNEPLLQQKQELNQLAQKVNEAQIGLDATTSGSRAQGVQAQKELNVACDNYLSALNKELTGATDQALIDALNREIAAVKALMKPIQNSTR